MNGGDRIVCVGGSLHGKIIERSTNDIVYVEHGMSVEIVPPKGFADDNVTIKATQRFELYKAWRMHGLLVMMHADLRPDERERQTVGALAIAAGVNGVDHA